MRLTLDRIADLRRQSRKFDKKFRDMTPEQRERAYLVAIGLAEPDPPVIPTGRLIYFIEAVGSGRLKIGYSTNLERRLFALRQQSPFPLELRATAPTREYAERVLHKRFAALRVHGEWFRFEGELLAFVEALR